MAITVECNPAFFREALGVTAGNEYIWCIPQGSTFVIEAKGSGEAITYSSANPRTPADFSDLIAVSGVNTESFQDSPFVGGQRWVGVEITDGTWDITLVLSDQF